MRRIVPGFLFIAAVLTGGPAPAQPASAPRAIGIFTGAPPPPAQAEWWQDLVVEPTRTPPATVATLARAGATVIAAHAPGNGAAGERVRALVTAGYGGLVIDACDAGAGAAAAALFAAARKEAPTLRLFWRCPDTRPPPETRAVAVIVVDAFTQKRDDGTRVPLALPALQAAARALAARWVDRGVPVIAHDHLPAGRIAEARVLAEALALARIVPYVEIAGRPVGVGLVEPVPRKILGLYNRAEDDFLPNAILHRMVALPLEHLGYDLEYHDIERGLPGDLGGRYAGIVTWWGGNLTYPLDVAAWLVRQIDAGVRVAILGSLGASPTPALLERLGVTASRRPLVPPVTIVKQDGLSGFEAPHLPLSRGLPSWTATAGVRHVEIKDAQGQIAHPVVTGRFGGWAFDPYLLESGYQYAYRWRIDPFAFLSRALDLPPIPAPDATTESGRRLLMVHIDGDGFNGRSTLPGKAYSGEVIMREFLEIYRVPTTVSFVEGEIGPAGINPKLTAKLEPIAREIARLPHVELASHTFSHPFDWPIPLPPSSRKQPIVKVDSLPIRGYQFSPAREVRGSVEYVNQRIAPPGKKVKAVLWTGMALPWDDVIAEADALSIANVNGHNCNVPRDAPTLTQVPSLYRPVGKSMQVYAPAHNENVYIESSRLGDQLSAFRNIVRMFEFTEVPRRLKPINIYYHFYSGATLSGANALRDVYMWAVKQETFPVFLSEYAAKVAAWPQVRLARRIDGSWDVRGLGALRTLRVDERLGWPDLARSENVAGVRDSAQGRHVAVGPAANARLAFTPRPPEAGHLVSANAAVAAWVNAGNEVRFRLRGHLPVNATIGACIGELRGPAPADVDLEIDRARRLTRLRSSRPDTGDVVLRCR